MKWFGLLLVLPLPASGWWCETSDRHGCRGQSRHFVREAAVSNPFLVFEDIKTSYEEEPIVVDWDGDGDLDVILKKDDGLSLFEFKSGRHFVEVEPNPFHGIPGGDCRPAVVDWDGDGRLDLIVGAKDGIRYYQRMPSYKLHQRHGAENPFEHIWTKGACADVSIGDWDGDGDLDVLQSNSLSAVQYFEHSEGQLLPLEGPKSPFHGIANLTVTHRPIMADWNGDGNMDILLLAKVFGRLPNVVGPDIAQQSYCISYLYEQQKIGGKTTLVFKDEPFFRNEGCSSFDGSGASFLDVDGDGDLDAIFGSYDGPLHVYNRTDGGLVKPNKFPSNSTPLDMIQLESQILPLHAIFLHPVLADWDLDGDLDLALLGHPDPEKNRYFLHLPDHTVTELNGPPNSSCPINWTRHFSVADFDGDGKEDLVGFGRGVVVCLQTSSGFVVVEPEKIPFNYFPNCPQCLSKHSYYWMDGILGFPSFLDWDGDGDMDVLRKDLAEKVYFYEQLSNGTVFAHPLPLPSARDFSAADFDGDGDVDIMIVPLNSDSCLYFERLGDGSLEQLFGTDNPFNDVCQRTHGDLISPTNGIYASLGDWDGDGEKDLVVIADFKVTLWTNRPVDTFVEVSEKNSPFGKFGFPEALEVSLVDVNDDGRLDVVVPPQSSILAYARGYETYSFFMHGANGLLVEQLGGANPFDKITYNKTAHMGYLWRSKIGIVDLDGDGDLDIVHGDLQYTRNDGSDFTYLNRSDPDHPFLGVQDTELSCWTLVDWDRDGDLDLVQAYQPGNTTHEAVAHMHWATTILLEMLHNGTSRAERVAWARKNLYRQMRFYRNIGASFQELTGSANPFHDIALDDFSACPTFVDLDKDDVLELVLGTSRGQLQYFQQRNGTFQRVEETPFADLSIKSTLGPFGIIPRFVDWDGDGDVDLVITGTDKVHFFQRGICKPSVSYCQSGFCNQRTSKCICGTGAKGQDCSLCESGKFKNLSGNEECSVCPDGHFPMNRTTCVPCASGTVSSRDHPEKCTPCPEGSVPNRQKNSCDECTGQTYAFEGDEFCRTCFFPALILTGDENLCTPVYTVLFLFASILLAVFVLAIFGRLRVACLKRRLQKLVAARNWKDLHTTQARPLEYGLWQRRACKLLALRKAEVKSRSLQLGVSLDYVFGKLEDIYEEKAQQTEWRVDAWGPTTRSGFFVRVRNSGDAVDPESAWPTLAICDRPEDPNFHQVAAVLAYGPWALGKGLCCPRDGLTDCSLVDALEMECNSAKATWFLSWVWNYKFTTVVKALARWWQRHRMVLGATDDAKGIYIWWCLFVNNQFRLLESGQTQNTSDFVHVFGQQVEGIGKMLMCLDQMRSSQYTSRIWCIFEVFVACQRSIPTTVILPELEVGAIETLEDLTQQCQVDAEKAKASVQADADAIKELIQKEHQSFEYVNQTVEQALWCEVIKFLKQSPPEPEEIELSTETPQDLDLSTSSAPVSAPLSAEDSQCSLQ